MRRPLSVVYALIDWHNVMRHFAPAFDSNPARELPSALFRIQQAIVETIKNYDASAGYRVIMRIYHGWHSEHEPTPTRRTFQQFQTDVTLARKVGRVSFIAGFQFGNDLACGSSRNPLFSTHRSSGQKMVDTAICCDLLHLLHTKQAHIVVVVSDDDDFAPAAFTAAEWNQRAILLRPAGRTLGHVTDSKCDDLLRFWSTP